MYQVNLTMSGYENGKSWYDTLAVWNCKTKKDAYLQFAAVLENKFTPSTVYGVFLSITHNGKRLAHMQVN